AGGLRPRRPREEVSSVRAVGSALREIDRPADMVYGPGAGWHGKGVGRLATVAHDDRGHALHEVAVRVRVDVQREVSVSVRVDEAGRHEFAAGIDDTSGRCSSKI